MHIPPTKFFVKTKYYIFTSLLALTYSWKWQNIWGICVNNYHSRKCKANEKIINNSKNTVWPCHYSPHVSVNGNGQKILKIQKLTTLNIAKHCLLASSILFLKIKRVFSPQANKKIRLTIFIFKSLL